MNTNSREQQDIFVMLVSAKRNGYYLEIGSATPIQDNNTFLLESEFGWNGISIEINTNLTQEFREYRKNIIINEDAMKIDYLSLLNKYELPQTIDYLQIDCDPAINSLNILKKIPFDSFNFNIITFEHDFYNYQKDDISYTVRDTSREILKNRGYLSIGLNICHENLDVVFEDWWLSPKLDSELLSLFKYEDYTHKESCKFVNDLKDTLKKINHNNYQWLKSNGIDE